MKPLVIYHDKCADGFGAAFAAWLKLGDEAEYLPIHYKPRYEDEDLSSVEGREVYILDFSFPRVLMDDIFNRAKRVIWLDHHASVFKDWAEGNFDRREPFPPTVTAILDNNKSGAYLAWEYFHPGTEVPMAIKHIDDYDRWQFKLEGTKEFNKALWSYAPWSFDQWKNSFLGNEDSLDYITMISDGAAVLRAHEQNVQAVVKGASRNCTIDLCESAYFDGKIIGDNDSTYACGLAANCPPHLTSDVGHALATQSGTFGLLWYINNDGKCFCSLRSNGDYDVSAIAKAFGGGGHKNAAGFETNIQTLLEWIK
jgi:oligoribonuclease NrnB/cAMP/cGMP phosphodiesterase (DHH superfamily)